jgi:hypothetical protein
VNPLLRATVAGLLILLAVSATALAATTTKPYTIAPTRACLTQHGAHLQAAKLTTPRHQIEWVLATAAGFPVAIEMKFSANSVRAAAYERKLAHAYHAERLSKLWIRDHLYRRRNVVIHPDVPPVRVTASRVATIMNCLRS